MFEPGIFFIAPVFGVIKPVKLVWTSKKFSLSLLLLRSVATVSY